MIPLKDWMILKVIEQESEEGLVLPDSVKENPAHKDNLTFEILAMGEGWFDPMGNYYSTSDYVKVGDEVIMEGGLAINAFNIKGEEYIVGRVRDVAFILSRKGGE